MSEPDGTELDETIKAIQKSIDNAAAGMASVLTPLPPPEPPEPPKEFDLTELHSITLDAVSWREAAAQKTIQLANNELREVERMKQELFRRAIMEFGVDTSQYSVSLNSKTRKLIVTPK